MRPTSRTARFLLRFQRPSADPEAERETLVDVDGEARGAVLYLPRLPDGSVVDPFGSAGEPVPAWILLQGVTVPGRHHQGLRRMARSLAAAGHVVLTPEVPSWTELRVDPRHAEPTVRASLAHLGSLPGVDSHRIGLMGFSVAGTWALEVAAGESGAALRAAVSLGGYGDFRRTLIAMVTGEHEWRGRTYRHTPDPYGRWIVASDLLPRMDSTTYGTQEQREVAARALHRLARTAGRNGALAGTPTYDRLIDELRRTLPAAVSPAWDVLAPPSTQLVPDPGAGRALADALATAGLAAHPELDPTGRLDGLASQRTRVILLHGRQDTLIPFTETLRLAALLPHGAPRTVALTRLIGHAKAAEGLLRPTPAALVTLVYELYRFAATMRRIVGSLAGAT